MTAVRTTAAATLTATLGLAAGCWVVSVWQMTGMDMGVATRLGSFAFFAAVWMVMMGGRRDPKQPTQCGPHVLIARDRASAAALIIQICARYALCGHALDEAQNEHLFVSRSRGGR